jgi:hypothetical protein
MKRIRPISLHNCSLKIITKSITNRIPPIGSRIISQTQTTFIKRRYILEVSAHEVIHVVHSNDDHGLVLKLDYEKAYNRIDWQYLDAALVSMGFGPVVRGWLRSVLVGGSLCVSINYLNSSYFVAGKGLKQGDAMSPILFNCMAYVFSKCG